jgi:hypothetical protein
MKGATWFNLTAIVGADQIATLWDRADEGDDNADKVAVALTCWSDKHREKAPPDHHPNSFHQSIPSLFRIML